MGVFLEFDIWGASYERLDVEGWKGDEVGFRLVGRIGWREG